MSTMTFSDIQKYLGQPMAEAASALWHAVWDRCRHDLSAHVPDPGEAPDDIPVRMLNDAGLIVRNMNTNPDIMSMDVTFVRHHVRDAVVNGHLGAPGSTPYGSVKAHMNTQLAAQIAATVLNRDADSLTTAELPSKARPVAVSDCTAFQTEEGDHIRVDQPQGRFVDGNTTFRVHTWNPDAHRSLSVQTGHITDLLSMPSTHFDETNTTVEASPSPD